MNCRAYLKRVVPIGEPGQFFEDNIIHPRDLRFSLLQILVDDPGNPVQIVKKDVLHFVDFRVDVSWNAEVDNEQRLVRAFFQCFLDVIFRQQIAVACDR